ncbi:MAG: SDR family oxidoreductase [Alphaproteobacteria bacterium]|nr:SDR family oxidoreductase [Alphaproteobacteria bacterium]
MTPCALVTGASRGVGRALVDELLARDVRVIAAVRRVEASDLVGVDVVPLDLADPASLAELGGRVAGLTDRLHRVYNVAGVLHGPGMRPEKRLEDLDPRVLHDVFAVNAFGPIAVVQAVLPLLRHTDPAVVVNLSARVGSIGDNGLGGWYGYRASKAALNQLTRTLAVELRRRAPNVVAVAYHPGTVDTDLSRPFTKGYAGRVFSRQEAARYLLQVTDGLGADDSGGFFAWDGAPIPW